MTEIGMGDGLLMSSWKVLVVARGTQQSTVSHTMDNCNYNGIGEIFNICTSTTNGKYPIESKAVASSTRMIDISDIKIISISCQVMMVNYLRIENFWYDFGILAQKEKITPAQPSNKKTNIISDKDITER